MTDSAPIYDDKAHVRGNLDLRAAEWKRPPEPEPEDGHVEIAFVEHTDGATYVAMRNSKQLEPVLVFTMAEWDAFVAGAKDGEFDEPW
ncbi:DUF397 domain-containing protein [Lentzea sp. NPDC004789]|jgi:hypothetical protein